MKIEEIIKSKRNERSSDLTELDSRKESLIDTIKQRLLEYRDYGNATFDEKLSIVRQIAFKLLDDETARDYKDLLLTSFEKNEIIDNMIQSMFGYGVIEPYIHNEDITEIMVNGLNCIFIEKAGKLTKLKNSKGENVRFKDEDEILHVIDKIVAPINRKVDQSDPIVDARLPDGSRVNIVLPPASLIGPVITIRKFPKEPFTIDKLIEFGALSEEVAEILYQLVVARYNIVVSGGTGSGKTTFLNALSQYIPTTNRIITVEDSAELQITQVENLISLETRPPNVEGKGEITIRDLVKSALRMRPDRIVVGEVRGGEALDMLQAMNTGHDGSLTTGHANSCEDMLSRLETMVLMGGVDLPLKSIRQQIASAVDVIVHLRKFHDGSRKVSEITEIVGLEGDEIITNRLASIDYKDDYKLKFTGSKLINKDKFEYIKINLSEKLGG